MAKLLATLEAGGNGSVGLRSKMVYAVIQKSNNIQRGATGM